MLLYDCYVAITSWKRLTLKNDGSNLRTFGGGDILLLRSFTGDFAVFRLPTLPTFRSRLRSESLAQDKEKQLLLAQEAVYPVYSHFNFSGFENNPKHLF